MTARYGLLLDEWAVWFVPLFDFTKLPLPVVSLNIRLEPGASRGGVTRALRREYPWSLEFGWAGVGPLIAQDLLIFVITIPSAAGIEDLERFTNDLSTVKEVAALVMVRTHSFTDWFDDLLAQAAPALPSSGRANAETVPRRAGFNRLSRAGGIVPPRMADGAVATQ